MTAAASSAKGRPAVRRDGKSVHPRTPQRARGRFVARTCAKHLGEEGILPSRRASWWCAQVAFGSRAGCPRSRLPCGCTVPGMHGLSPTGRENGVPHSGFRGGRGARKGAIATHGVGGGDPESVHFRGPRPGKVGILPPKHLDCGWRAQQTRRGQDALAPEHVRRSPRVGARAGKSAPWAAAPIVRRPLSGECRIMVHGLERGLSGS